MSEKKSTIGTYRRKCKGCSRLFEMEKGAPALEKCPSCGEEHPFRRKERGGVYFVPGKRGIAKFSGKMGKWHITFRVDGKQYRESTEAHGKQEAAQKRLDRIEEKKSGAGNSPMPMLLQELSEEYFNSSITKKRKRESSLELDRIYHRRILDFFKNVLVDQISESDCEAFMSLLTKEWEQKAWRSKTEVRYGTVDRYVGALKRLFTWGIKAKLITDNPAAEVELHRQPRRPYHLITPQEEARLLEAARTKKAPHLVPIIELALETAMRKGEILGLEWNQVSFENGLITVEVAEGRKGKRTKYIPITPTAEKVLREQLKARTDGDINYVFHRDGKPLGEVKTAWHNALKKAGLPKKIRFHDLRHTSISRMIMSGINTIAVGRIAGWSDKTAHIMLRHYTHLSKDHLHEAAEAMDAWRNKQEISISFDNNADAGTVEKETKAL